MELLQYVFSKVLFMSFASIAVYIQVRMLQFAICKIATKQWRYYSWLLLIVFLLVPVQMPDNVDHWLKNTSVEIVCMKLEEHNSITSDPGLYNEVGPDNNIVSKDNLHRNESVENNSWRIFLKYASLLWLIGIVIILAARIIIREQYIHKLHKTIAGQEIDPEWECHLRELLFKEAAVIKMRRIPRISVSFHVSSPMIFGVVKPTIYLPAIQTDIKELEVILKHELIHYQRHDLIYKELMSITKMIHWFNPLIWLVEKELDNDCELSCDELVIQGMSSKERRFYGKTLLSTIFKERQLNQYTIAALHRKGGSTETRIKEIMGFNKMQIKFLVMFGIMCLFAGVGVTSLVSAAIINSSNHTVYVERESDNSEVSTNKNNEIANNENLNVDHDDKIEKVTPYIHPGEKSDKETENQVHNNYYNDEFDRVNYKFKGYSIQYYMNYPASFDKETLNQALIDYVAKSQDIGAVFCVIDYLTTDTVDTITETYLNSSKDYGMFYSLQDYLSKSMKSKLKKIVEKNIGPMNNNRTFNFNYNQDW